MHSSYVFRNYLFRIGLINYQDFPKIIEDINNPKSQILSLSQLLETAIKIDPFEFAERVFLSWKKCEEEKRLERLLEIRKSSLLRKKLKYFLLWKMQNSPKIRSKPPFEHLYREPREPLNMSYNIFSKSNSERSNSLSCKSEAKQLLSTTSSKPLMYTRKDSPESLEGFKKKPTFYRLYEDAAAKESSLERTRKEIMTREMEECTFRPIVTSQNDRLGSVFERLHQSDSKERDQLYKYQRENKETQECTFKPKINPPKTPPGEKSYNKLYQDAEVQRQKLREKELVNKDKEIKECTFRPAVNPNSNYIGTGNVYEKLYNNFQEMQKERQKKLMESRIKEVAEVQFVPKLMSPKVSTEPVAYVRLYGEAEKRKEKQKLVEEQERERSKSAPRAKKTDEVPRFEHLYALHKDKIERNAVLQEKYLKESGVVFKPNLVKNTGTPKRKRDFSPKMPYPTPKNPYSDISSQSSFT
ncbi:hypothetical protein SteCoe_9461 [Stentor coeruleus]|uniref:Uncharacterized protein n=1 Tax=Stentor coeruleus TaxID=5963 RepID=A0A1R2CI16_9CILI|nr:hypothetical protein SteCoe_9461 [Stentor coeruleus]